MADECIHGFDDGLCAICFPPKAPEPAAQPEPASRAHRVPGRRPSAVPPPAPARTARAKASERSLSAPPVDAGALRIYHVTHLDNLARILGAGALVPDAAGASPVVDLAAPAVREFRRGRTVEGTDAVIADYVPFLLTPDALVWNAVREGTPDPRLTAEAVERPAADHVMLVSSVAAARGAATAVGAVAVSDVDAALPGAELAVSWPAVERTLRVLAHEQEVGRLLTAEFLVRGEVPLERIALIAVGNERVRDRVRAALSAVGAKTRIAVYPPWFLPAED
ncbi:DarT ssDNA thymidine ADP-ribosyltransferase family protein [Agromyces mediolanus]|uniref:DarT ssDNA thymidine ADP-ribosyltransferase family protein n=1 Tax=Agromyces mediolanus TaxID=41986 RepID=UPI0038375A6B